jgi:tripartite-type tricarboxylate transporter receptor subunit TctC
MIKRPIKAALAALAVAGIGLAGAAAQAAPNFKGKEIGFSVGGSYTLYARMVGEAMERHLPGNPNIIVQNTRGAGGVKAANYLANVAPQDGTYLGWLADSMAVSQLLFPKKKKFDGRKFFAIGSVTNVNPTMVIHKRAGVKTYKELMTKEVILGCSGRGSQTYVNGRSMREFLGFKFKMICGYGGSAPQTLAMLRGEVDAQSSAWASWRIRQPHLFKDGTLIPLVQVGLKKEADLQHIPLAIDLAKDDKARAALTFISSMGAIGRWLSAPPGTPADVVAALRDAFDKSMKDPKFLAEAKKRDANVDPTSGVELQKLIAQAYETPQEIIESTQRGLKGYKKFKNCKGEFCKKKKKKKKKDS